MSGETYAELQAVEGATHRNSDHPMACRSWEDWLPAPGASFVDLFFELRRDFKDEIAACAK
jgi:hypothetical protein